MKTRKLKSPKERKLFFKKLAEGVKNLVKIFKPKPPKVKV